MNILHGKVVQLRPLEINDLDTLYLWENNPGVWQASVNLTPFSKFFLEQYILNAQNNIYQDRQLRLIIENMEGLTVGMADLFDFDPHHRRAAVGILIGEPFRDKTYASETLDILIKYATRVLSLHQLYCTIEHGNPVSQKLFVGKGFQLTGTRIAWNLRGSAWVNEDFLQLILNP